MALHEVIIVETEGDNRKQSWTVTRVASGWIYENDETWDDHRMGYFVPFDNKFHS